MKILPLSIICVVFVTSLFSAQNAFAGCIAQTNEEIDPQSAVSDGHLYKTYALITGCVNAAVFFKSSNDNGTTFEPQIQISDTIISGEPQIATSGSNVLIAWAQYGSNPEIIFRKSTDNGSTFENPVIVAQTSGSFYNKKIITSGNNIEIIWSGNTDDYNRAEFLSMSTNGGTSFEDPIMLSNKTEDSPATNVTQSGNTIYINIDAFGKCVNGSFGCFSHNELVTFDVNDPAHTQKLIVLSNPVPEFPLASFVLITSILLIIMVSAKTKLRF